VAYSLIEKDGMPLTPYKSRTGKHSGVNAYEAGRDYIVVQFKTYKQYRYTYSSAGTAAVEEMKWLASNQEGLSTFISRNNPPYVAST
jgi:hypothetical protein